MTAIIDYGAGNLASVANAMRRIGAPFTVTNHRSTLDEADRILFPGVGHAWAAMEALRERDVDIWLRTTRKPVLGICLGMQLLYESSEEGGDTDGLGLIPGRLRRFDPAKGKVPHMGWNTVGSESYYFVHSYFAPVTAETVAESEHNGQRFAAMVSRGNFHGVQFHPEKSAEAGEALLRRFLDTGSIR
jgi:glutamine amidotransferase